MCFSATSSFSAAAFAAFVGVLTLSRAAKAGEAPLAAVPLLFALQQAIEGSLWLALPQAGHAAQVTALADGFGVIALVVWPVYAPTSVALVENIGWRRGLMGLLILLGMLFAADSALDIARHPYHAEIASHGLCNINNSPYPPYSIVVYGLATCAGFLLSSHPALRLFGLAITGGLAVALTAFLAQFVSVWCFFVAISSGVLVLHFWRNNPAGA